MTVPLHSWPNPSLERAVAVPKPSPRDWDIVPGPPGRSEARRPRIDNDSVDPGSRASRVRDLAYAAALVEGSERLRRSPDLPTLLSAIAAEAATLIDADDVAVVRYGGIRCQVLDVHVPTHLNDQAYLDTLRAAADETWLVTLGSLSDLASDPRWCSRSPLLAASSWRSVLTAALASPTRRTQIRVSWFSTTPGAFENRATIADIFARHANLAIQAVDERENLNLAVRARHRVGQAQGILMTRHQLTADQAFTMLVCHSQTTNIKLNLIADYVIETGQLPPKP